MIVYILMENKLNFQFVHLIHYENFPWFKNQTVNDITKVETFGQGHLYWENLDIDLSLEMIEHPERFPLQARVA